MHNFILLYNFCLKHFAPINIQQVTLKIRAERHASLNGKQSYKLYSYNVN
jgi:hypothetical protein